MLRFPALVRIYLAEALCDMRKSFDGLSALVLSALGLDQDALVVEAHAYAYRRVAM